MTRRIAIAALLIGLILWLTPKLFPTPPRPVAATTADGKTPAGVVPRPDSARAVTSAGTASAAPNGSGTPAAATTPSNAATSTGTTEPGAKPDTTVIRDSLGEIRFSSRGAAVVGATVAKYRSLQPGAAKRSPIELARPGEPLLSYQISTPAGITPLADAAFTGTQVAGGHGVEYSASTPAGAVDIRYAVAPDSYVVHVTGKVDGVPAGSALLVTLPQGLRSAEVDTLDDMRHFAIAYKRKTSDATGVPFTKVDAGEKQEIRGPLTWAVTKSKYFMVAVAATDTMHSFGDMTITGGPRATKAVSPRTTSMRAPASTERGLSRARGRG